MISISKKNRAPSRIGFRKGLWCEQLLGSLRGRLAPAGVNRMSRRLERGLRGEESIAEFRVQPVADGPRGEQDEEEDEERRGELGADLLQEKGGANRHSEVSGQKQNKSAEKGSFHGLAPFGVLFFAALLRQRLGVSHDPDNNISVAYMKQKVKPKQKIGISAVSYLKTFKVMNFLIKNFSFLLSVKT